MKTYSLKACEDFINKYINEYNGEVLQIDEGILGLGVMLLHGAPNCKTFVIKERYVSAWKSTHSLRSYKVIPKKYKKLINTL